MSNTANDTTEIMTLPKLGEKLTEKQIGFLEILAKQCRGDLLRMLINSQSGHPGGSASSLDYLVVLGTHLSQTGEEFIISNGHITPAIYSILANFGYVDREDVIENFRKAGSLFEGHVCHKLPRIPYGTGPLGIGASVAAGLALSHKLKNSKEKVYLSLGDGELQEGQVYEMANFAKNHALDNLIAFVDYNGVQLSGGMDDIYPTNVRGPFESAGWHIIERDGHDIQQIWDAISEANTIVGKPTVIICKTVMGKGVELMEPDGKAYKSTRHGKTPSPAQLQEEIEKLKLNPKEELTLKNIQKNITNKPTARKHIDNLTPLNIDTGESRVYTEITDCRTAYGKALVDLARLNPEIYALSADLRDSVMTGMLAKEMPQRHIECGIAEQNMVSVAGGLSIKGLVPFVSTFGNFMTKRAADQVRLNDINETNVKMFATHCGISVGEDGKTHQAIDDVTSLLGLFNTMIAEPSDANMMDHLARYFANHYGNVYVRTGRHKMPIITKEDGTPFYDEKYEYIYGKTDTIFTGTDLSIVAIGSAANEAYTACKKIQETHPGRVELVIASSPKKFDDNLFNSIRKTGNVITIEDHNTNGLGAMLAKQILQEGINIGTFKFESIGVDQYQSSGKHTDLYDRAGISAKKIAQKIIEEYLTHKNIKVYT